MGGGYVTIPLAERLPLKLIIEDDAITVESMSASSWVDEELRVSPYQANAVFV